MACSRSLVIVALSLVLLQGAQGLGHGHKLSAAMEEEMQAFDQAGAALESQGYKAFLSAASTSARSTRDAERQNSLDDLVARDRSFDVQVSDDFAAKVDDEWDTVSLRELAKEHWEGIKSKLSPKQAAPAANPEPTAQKPQASLRNLLMSAGHAQAA
uniref:Uncharacterized protein n=1 Tax=Alexandrium andersonii TaxID=327968 RepID=A0A7S2JH53_9DINO|mmetsp:Transcript_99495/g.223048  ORF Transcript_99495/g.223048 Transcript_99495/m.223048 type:complete len:157 (+) Transcript_99495:76-546(+)